MDTEQFLTRVIADQGNYASVGWFSYYGSNRYFNTRSWPLSAGFKDAVNTLNYWSQKGCDVYHALATYTAAQVKTTRTGRQYTDAPRQAANAHSMKVLVADCDVLRAGEVKDPSLAFDTRGDALTWVGSFIQATGLPRPNITVDSGHGFHLYWTLDTSLPIAQWQTLADALAAALDAHGFKGDKKSTVDAARILRPPGSVNMKSGVPVPVSVIDALTLPDYPLQQMVTALAPFVQLRQQRRKSAGGGGAVPIQLGPRPADLPPPDPTLADAAGKPERPPYKYANISTKCLQAKLTVAQHGAKQSRDHWRLSDLTLLGYCVDGDRWVHPISDGYHGYSQAETDREYADARQAVQDGVGPPLCETYDGHRKSVCDTCPFKGKVSSPLFLGLDDNELPKGWRRSTRPYRCIERHIKEDIWRPVIMGDFFEPYVRELPGGGHELTVTYDFDRMHVVALVDKKMGQSADLVALLGGQGVTCDPQTAQAIRDLAVAWINKLREMQQVSRDVVRLPFGWNSADGKLLGFAVAGTLYCTDGSEKLLACEDRQLASTFTPKGDLKPWRAAAALFAGQRARPELQALIAASFGAPLVALTSDIRGMTTNFWSAGSGVGKTTAIKVGVSIWGDYASVQSMKDTPNAVMHSIGGARVLVKYWDEFRVAQDSHKEFVDLIYTIPQGKEKMRLGPDLHMRPMGQWETLLVTTSNRPYADILYKQTEGTDSGVVRLLDVEMSKDALPFDALAGPVIKGVETNYGHAGRIYAAFLGANGEAIRAQLAGLLQQISTDLGLVQEERYYATAIAVIVAGASFAKKLNLFDFDVHGIYQVLKDAVLASRASRGERSVVTKAGKFDLTSLLSGFISAWGDARMRTDTLGTVGNQAVTVYLQPRTEFVRVQVAHKQGVVRLHRGEFTDWLDAQGLSSSLVISQMISEWNAKMGRHAIGAGTKYTSGRLWCVDIPRGNPDLEEMFNAGDSVR